MKKTEAAFFKRGSKALQVGRCSVVWDFLVHCRMFGRISGLYPPDATKQNPLLPVVTTSLLSVPDWESSKSTWPRKCRAEHLKVKNARVSGLLIGHIFRS